MALQTCKTKYSIRQTHQLTQTMTHCKVAARPVCGRSAMPHDDCPISVPFYGHGKGTCRRPCDSRAGTVRSSQEPTVIVRFLCSIAKRAAKTLRSPHDRRATTVRCPYGYRAMLLRLIYGLRFYDFIFCINQS